MMARIRKSLDEKEKGFTLIELLVVIIIIGILSAIAIPVFLNQRQKAVDSGIKSDIRTVATQMEVNFTDTQAYTAATTNLSTVASITVGTVAVPITMGNVMTVTLGTNVAAFCVFGVNAGGTGATTGFTYISNKGGLQTGASAATKCPAVGAF